jgi:hypothetical protein
MRGCGDTGGGAAAVIAAFGCGVCGVRGTCGVRGVRDEVVVALATKTGDA